MRTDRHALTISGVLLTAILGFTLPMPAQTLATLYNFTGGDDGTNPHTGLAIGSGGVLYGTTSNGGISSMVPYFP